jgi:hypothetical protein
MQRELRKHASSRCVGVEGVEKEVIGDTCDVESAGFTVCSESPDFVAQLWGKLLEDGKHLLSCSYCHAKWFEAVRCE